MSVETGLTYPGFSDLPVKQAMIDSADEVFSACRFDKD